MKKESVDHPPHYGGDSPYEAIKVIEAWDLNFNLGNVAKYVARAGKKTDDPLHDLRKAKWYLEREILMLERAATGWNTGSSQLRDYGDRHNF